LNKAIDFGIHLKHLDLRIETKNNITEEKSALLFYAKGSRSEMSLGKSCANNG